MRFAITTSLALVIAIGTLAGCNQHAEGRVIVGA